MVDPVTVNRLILDCVNNSFKYAVYEVFPVEGGSRVRGKLVAKYVSVPVCSKNVFLCDYAGQQVRNGVFVCDGALKRDRKSLDDLSGLED